MVLAIQVLFTITRYTLSGHSKHTHKELNSLQFPLFGLYYHCGRLSLIVAIHQNELGQVNRASDN